MNEVKLDDGSQSNGKVEFPATVGVVAEDHDGHGDEDWVSLNELGENFGLPHDVKYPQTISEQIAQVSAEPNPSCYIPDDNCRNSSCHISPERPRRSHHSRLADFVLRYSGYTWPWSLDAGSLSIIWSRLRFGKINTGVLGSVLCVPPFFERSIC